MSRTKRLAAASSTMSPPRCASRPIERADLDTVARIRALAEEGWLDDSAARRLACIPRH